MENQSSAWYLVNHHETDIRESADRLPDIILRSVRKALQVGVENMEISDDREIVTYFLDYFDYSVSSE
jgi:hypothetical protein